MNVEARIVAIKLVQIWNQTIVQFNRMQLVGSWKQAASERSLTRAYLDYPLDVFAASGSRELLKDVLTSEKVLTQSARQALV